MGSRPNDIVLWFADVKSLEIKAATLFRKSTGVNTAFFFFFFYLGPVKSLTQKFYVWFWECYSWVHGNHFTPNPLHPSQMRLCRLSLIYRTPETDWLVFPSLHTWSIGDEIWVRFVGIPWGGKIDYMTIRKWCVVGGSKSWLWIIFCPLQGTTLHKS